MPTKWSSQGAVITLALMKKPHTYSEMLALGVSLSPWKRAKEYLSRVPGLVLVKTEKKVGDHKLTAWRVIKAEK